MLFSLMAGHASSGVAIYCTVDYKGERLSNPVYRSFITSFDVAIIYKGFQHILLRAFIFFRKYNNEFL